MNYSFGWFGHEEVFASEVTNSVVFVVDTSESMTKNDKNKQMIDYILQTVHALPSYYEVGVVTYSGDVGISLGMLQYNERESLRAELEGLRYTGYTNAGAGLTHALELLQTANRGVQEQFVVMVSDGEISLRTELETQESVTVFEQAIDAAIAEGVPVHLLGIGSGIDPTATHSAIVSETAKTQGVQQFISEVSAFSEAMESILVEGMNVKLQTLSYLQSDGEIATLSLSIPDVQARKVKLYLQSSGVISNVSADFTANAMQQYQGDRFAVFEFDGLSQKEINLTLQSGVDDVIRVSSVAEYELTPQLEIVYIDTLPENRNATWYQREAEISISFVDSNNHNMQLFDGEYFENLEVQVVIDGEQKRLPLQSGRLVYDCEVDSDEVQGSQHTIEFDFDALPIHVQNKASLTFLLDAPPEILRDESWNFWLGGAVVAMAILWYASKKKSSQKQTELAEPIEQKLVTPLEKSKYNYIGRLLITIVKTKTHRDLPSLTFELFQVTQSQISLQEILNKLHVSEEFMGASRILLKSAPNKKLLLSNLSDCTIMKQREILFKNQTHEFPMHSEIEILFEDEHCEILLQYKEKI